VEKVAALAIFANNTGPFHSVNGAATPLHLFSHAKYTLLPRRLSRQSSSFDMAWSLCPREAGCCCYL
jgi:hypothetical protein